MEKALRFIDRKIRLSLHRLWSPQTITDTALSLRRLSETQSGEGAVCL